MKFIVIMPTYNRISRVSRAIESVLAQTHTDWDLVVVNDGSTDGTLDVLEQYQDYRVHVLSYVDNRGANYARNLALNYIKEKQLAGYVTLLDDDDFYLDDSLAKMQRLIDSKKGHFWYSAACRNVNGELISKVVRSGVYSYIYDYMFGGSVENDMAHFISSDVALNSSFTERFRNSEEWFYFVKIAKEHDFYYFPDTIKMVEVLPGGLMSSGLNRDKKIDVLKLKLERLKNIVPEEYVQKNILSLMNSLVKSNRLSEAKEYDKKLLMLSRFKYKYFLFRLRSFFYKSM